MNPSFFKKLVAPGTAFVPQRSASTELLALQTPVAI